MPGLDRTGPQGQGSRTGRGLGKCNPRQEQTNNATSNEERPQGRGLGRGFGRAKGRGRS